MSASMNRAGLSHALARLKGRISAFRRVLARDQSGSTMLEFAYTMPIFVLLSMVSLELVNLALTQMRVSQVAMTVADNLSRAKMSVPLGLPRLREVDVNDTIIGAEAQAGGMIDVLAHGRIVVSSLQRNASGQQTIAWQRCKGKLAITSQYGAQGATQPTTGSTGFQGMGRSTAIVRAEANSAIIFAEVTYDYHPIIGTWLLGTPRLRKEAAYYVRDDRDLVGGTQANGLYNPSPVATVAACNVYNDTF